MVIFSTLQLPWLHSVVGAAVAVAIFLSLSRVITLESNIGTYERMCYIVLYAFCINFMYTRVYNIHTVYV